MELGVLSQARKQLTARLALFTTGLIVIFALQSSAQLRENSKAEQRRQLQLLGLMAVNQLAEISSGLPGSLQAIEVENNRAMSNDLATRNTTTGEIYPIRQADATGLATISSRERDVRILWIGPQMNILDEYGSFVPGGSLVPPIPQRHMPQSIQLNNGTALWLPVQSRASRSKPQQLLGFVAIASSDAPSTSTAMVSLITATAASVILALLGIPWILERSLQPLRDQINRLRDFSGDVAHELRNPMMALQTSLANASKVVQQDHSNRAVAMAVLEPLNTIIKRMSSILDDILLLTNLANGTDDAAEASITIDIADLFDELAIFHYSEARIKEVHLLFEVESPVLITMIPSRAQRILSNLITNAIRFSARDGTVRVTACAQAGVGLIRVDDDGPGIPEADYQRVFQRLVQLQPGQDPSHRGLGLALCRNLVHLHGGTLDVQKSPSGGCRMQWSWPLQAPSAGRLRSFLAGASQ